jgi:hypothetical protein
VSRGSYDKLHQATGWAPLIALHVSLDDIVDDLEERRREL